VPKSDLAGAEGLRRRRRQKPNRTVLRAFARLCIEFYARARSARK
jgi:hypothetical protein